MGGKSSKTKPNAPPLSRTGTLTTFIVTVDPSTEIEDDMHPTESTPHGGGAPENCEPMTVRTSKVQEILEGKVELKKQQQLEHLPQATPHFVSLDLNFSSSEESDDSDGGKKKRKGAKKKKKKHPTGSYVPQAASQSQPKPPLNEVKSPKKTSQTKLVGRTDHFEQIKDAYALAEYTAKDKEDDDACVIADTTAQTPPPKSKQKPSPSPGSSPSKLFGAALDMWRSPAKTLPQRSNQTSAQDVSQHSPGKGASNLSAQSAKSTSSHSSRVHSGRWPKSTCDSDSSDLDLKEFELETSSPSRFASTGVRLPLTDGKVTEERYAVKPEPVKSARSERRNLRIDDTDESIMDDILAEVIT